MLIVFQFSFLQITHRLENGGEGLIDKGDILNLILGEKKESNTYLFIPYYP